MRDRDKLDDDETSMFIGISRQNGLFAIKGTSKLNNMQKRKRERETKEGYLTCFWVTFPILRPMHHGVL
jgi:hypothetical protein